METIISTKIIGLSIYNRNIVVYVSFFLCRLVKDINEVGLIKKMYFQKVGRRI